jgi:hypothetical protein
MFSSLVHWMLSLSISYPYLIKFHDFESGGDEASNGGCNSGPIGHDFPHNSTIYFLFFTMRTGPFPKCEDRSSSQIECQVRILIPVLMTVLIPTENRIENWRRISSDGWEPPNTGLQVAGGWWAIGNTIGEHRWEQMGNMMGTQERKFHPHPAPPKRKNEHTLVCMFSSFIGCMHILFLDMVATIPTANTPSTK